MAQQVTNCLAARSALRSVSLLPNRQVELAWDRVTVTMRLPDLIVLNNTLRDWMEDLQRTCAQVYTLSLDSCVLFIHSYDLYCFCDMVHEATEQLPRRVVRWADVQVRIAPYNQQAKIGCFTPN
ncbi:MAG: hypothetical protein KF832_16125 [Caldilineaceae bacterium]|nr:hypothetical protein [Caldilineaceae bacterium]